MNVCSNLKFAICILQFAVITNTLAILSVPAKGDEGMWLFNNPPKRS